MNCTEAGAAIAAALDGELDPVQGRALDAHLADCPACVAERASLADLKQRIAAAAPRHAAPAALRRDVVRMLAEADAAGHTHRPATRAAGPARAALGQPGARGGRRAFAAGALAGAATLTVGWLGTTTWLARRADDALAHRLVDAHVRAVLGDQLVSVVSSDQHTVKPWLSARLDYSPPIVEVPIAGVTLAGARIEAVGGERVATLVYRYRAHVVDVFVRPIGPASRIGAPTTVRGFNVAESAGAGMEWRAVSDASLQTLRPLVEALANAGPR